jgi:hypothetical protein
MDARSGFINKFMVFSKKIFYGQPTKEIERKLLKNVIFLGIRICNLLFFIPDDTVKYKLGHF